MLSCLLFHPYETEDRESRLAGSVGAQTITHQGEVETLHKSLLPTSTCTPPPLSTTALGHGARFIQQCGFGRHRAPALTGPAGAEGRGGEREGGKGGHNL